MLLFFAGAITVYDTIIGQGRDTYIVSFDCDGDEHRLFECLRRMDCDNRVEPELICQGVNNNYNIIIILHNKL